ncbi:DedA family protein [Albimonas sp. CAU 1670]|uniref:DedA family protein n=1 Tax=Albimonas sp. CAU 1670 TaxID=3032599 RepID=UPI0023DCE2D5|nr:DedA family protein [Albimonas sp. CAU 1670]MDF2233553.1 DedA family protein [Albimonas sp. CAU 1670]
MVDWMQAVIEAAGAAGVAALMFLENLFPPIPSELVMPLSGYVAHLHEGGVVSLLWMILGGVLGSTAGALLWYWIGLRIGTESLQRFARRHGRWLTLTPGDVRKADAWFDRWGGWAVLLGRMVPTVRTFVSVPAGVSGMRLRPFLALTVAGTTVWVSALAGAGWALGAEYDAVSAWLDPVATAVLVAIAAIYLYRVATFRRTVRRQDAARGADG